MTTRRGVFAFILGAVAAAKLKPSPGWVAIMPPQPVTVVEIDELLKAHWAEYRLPMERLILYGYPSDPHPFEGLVTLKEHDDGSS